MLTNLRFFIKILLKEVITMAKISQKHISVLQQDFRDLLVDTISSLEQAAVHASKGNVSLFGQHCPNLSKADADVRQALDSLVTKQVIAPK